MHVCVHARRVYWRVDTALLIRNIPLQKQAVKHTLGYTVCLHYITLQNAGYYWNNIQQ